MKSGEVWKQQGRTLPTQADMSKLAKADYEKSDSASKIAVLNRMGKIDQSCASYKELTEAIKQNRPVLFYSIGTTGIKADDELMQLAIGGIGFGKEVPTRTFLFPVSKAVLDRAEESKKDYDIFANSGFDRPVEKNGLGVSTKEYISICAANATTIQPEYKNKRIYEALSKDFGINSNKDFSKALVVGLNPEFAEKFLEARQIALFRDSIDILNVIKEFDYTNSDAPLNETGSRYSLAGIISQFDGAFNNGDNNLYSCANKVDAMKFVTAEIAQRDGLIKTPEKSAPVVSDSVVQDINQRAKELNEMLSKIVQTFVDVLVVTTKTIEDNTKTMQELKDIVSGISPEKAEALEAEEPEEDFER